jgi:hypothetical protein
MEDLAEHDGAVAEDGPVLDGAVKDARPTVAQASLADHGRHLVVDRAAIGPERVRADLLRLLLAQPEGGQFGDRRERRQIALGGLGSIELLKLPDQG